MKASQLIQETYDKGLASVTIRFESGQTKNEKYSSFETAKMRFKSIKLNHKEFWADDEDKPVYAALRCGGDLVSEVNLRS